MSQAPLRKRVTPESLRFRALAAEFAERAIRELDGAIQAIVLYGSVARGEATPESDIDLFVVTPQSTEVGERLRAIEFGIWEQSNCETRLMSYAVDYDHIAGLVRIGSPYLRDVLNDGIIFYDDGTFSKLRREVLKAPYWRYMTSAHPPEFARFNLTQAAEMLFDAQSALQNERLRSAADRAYYAMFHAATAAVSQAVPRLPRTHDGLQTLFSLHFVASGKLPPSFATDLNNAFSLRRSATYDPAAVIREDVVALFVEKAETFVAAIRQLLGMEELS